MDVLNWQKQAAFSNLRYNHNLEIFFIFYLTLKKHQKTKSLKNVKNYIAIVIEFGAIRIWYEFYYYFCRWTNLPVQFTPFPLKPLLHWHVKLPMELLQVALVWQLFNVELLHSSTSATH